MKELKKNIHSDRHLPETTFFRLRAAPLGRLKFSKSNSSIKTILSRHTRLARKWKRKKWLKRQYLSKCGAKRFGIGNLVSCELSHVSLTQNCEDHHNQKLPASCTFNPCEIHHWPYKWCVFAAIWGAMPRWHSDSSFCPNHWQLNRKPFMPEQGKFDSLLNEKKKLGKRGWKSGNWAVPFLQPLNPLPGRV